MLFLCRHGLVIHMIQSWVIWSPSWRIWRLWTMSPWCWIATLMPVYQSGKQVPTLYWLPFLAFRCTSHRFSLLLFPPTQHHSSSFSFPSLYILVFVTLTSHYFFFMRNSSCIMFIMFCSASFLAFRCANNEKREMSTWRYVMNNAALFFWRYHPFPKSGWYCREIDWPLSNDDFVSCKSILETCNAFLMLVFNNKTCIVFYHERVDLMIYLLNPSIGLDCVTLGGKDKITEDWGKNIIRILVSVLMQH